MTELEVSVTGVVWRDGPVSAYQVRERFRVSMTPAWSSSCGTIYPVIRRLLDRGLIAASEPINRRGTQHLTITAAGRKAVTEWMLSSSPEIAAPVPDPIRTRLQYISVLPQEDAERFVDEAIAATRRSLHELVESLASRAETSWLDFLAALGSVHQVRARLTWLIAIRPALSGASEARAQLLAASLALAGTPLSTARSLP